MITTMIYYGWFSLLIGGIGLLFGSKYRKTGFTLITLFLTPIALLFLVLWNVGPYDCWLQPIYENDELDYP